MRDYPGRRYPPSPYPPRTEETRLYRDGWDDAWNDVTRHGVRRAIERFGELEDGPYKHGYLDGGDARIAREVKAIEAEKRWREVWRREDREAEARRAQDEGAW